MRVTTRASEIAEYFEKRIQRLEKAVSRKMCYVGERCINAARSSHTYIDRTGNLTSSIGYAVSINGNLVKCSSFGQVKNGADGSKDGKEYVMSLISKYPQSIALIVVAGKNYAAFVSDKGYDVLDSAEILAERLVPQFLKQLGISV